jgi:hypothetical protein
VRASTGQERRRLGPAEVVYRERKAFAQQAAREFCAKLADADEAIAHD